MRQLKAVRRKGGLVSVQWFRLFCYGHGESPATGARPSPAPDMKPEHSILRIAAPIRRSPLGKALDPVKSLLPCRQGAAQAGSHSVLAVSKLRAELSWFACSMVPRGQRSGEQSHKNAWPFASARLRCALSASRGATDEALSSPALSLQSSISLFKHSCAAPSGYPGWWVGRGLKGFGQRRLVWLWTVKGAMTELRPALPPAATPAVHHNKQGAHSTEHEHHLSPTPFTWGATSHWQRACTCSAPVSYVQW